MLKVLKGVDYSCNVRTTPALDLLSCVLYPYNATFQWNPTAMIIVLVHCGGVGWVRRWYFEGPYDCLFRLGLPLSTLYLPRQASSTPRNEYVLVHAALRPGTQHARLPARRPPPRRLCRLHDPLYSVLLDPCPRYCWP